MVEVDVRKCDWYGFSGFIVHRYCIWLSLPAPADSIRFQATCILHLRLPNAVGDDAGLKDCSHTPPVMALGLIYASRNAERTTNNEKKPGEIRHHL